MNSAEVGQKSAYISCKVEEGLEGLVVVAFSLHARVIGEGLMNYSLPGLPFRSGDQLACTSSTL